MAFLRHVRARPALRKPIPANGPASGPNIALEGQVIG